MSKYYPILEDVSDFLDIVPHPKANPIAQAIRACNDDNTETFTKIHAVARAIII